MTDTQKPTDTVSETNRHRCDNCDGIDPHTCPFQPPAGRLLAAADLIEHAGTDATSAPWTFLFGKRCKDCHKDQDSGVYTPGGELIAECPERLDAAWIALLGPDTAPALAAWLRAAAEADEDDPCQATTPADCYLRACGTHRALAFAEMILRDKP